MQSILGMQCAHDGSIHGAPTRLARAAELVVDRRWDYRFKLIGVAYTPTMPREPRFPGVIAKDHLQAAALEALSSASAERVSFSVSKKEVLDHADFKFDTGRRALHVTNSPQLASAKWRVPNDSTPEIATAAWIELQHAVLETLGATHGVIVTATDSFVLSAEIWLSVTSLNGKLMHPDPDEISSYEAQARYLGNQYIRRPRWGTYLKPAHVEAVGGRDKILAVVKPPVVRDVGDLLYVQLSERVADAAAPETLARQRAFTELVAPITMPRLPPR